MNVQKYLDEMKNFQITLLKYLDHDNDQQSYLNLVTFVKDQMNRKCPEEIKETFQLIVNIANNYHRQPGFFDKIDQLLLNIKDEIKQTFSNFDIFTIFKSNKRILLFLLKETILEIDQQIFDVINDNDYWSESYVKYFYFECKPFIPTKLLEELESDLSKIDRQTFEENRKIGENDQFICQLIRNDSIDDFITFVNQTNLPFSSKIKRSIYETNEYLLQKGSVDLIEYAAFFGSIQIFNYLLINKAYLRGSVWLDAIHGKNPEIIHSIQDNKIKPHDNNYKECLEEAVKCYSSEIVNFFLDNLVDENQLDFYFENRNYEFIPQNIQQPLFLFYTCAYNHVFFVDLLLKNKEIKVNEKIIQKKNFFNEIQN
ncbi:hypothetical protein M9Y10_034468 [Tritrichomonas musculus]|uniref:DUF3447 domain-containing protein n=1 Tax=Tritrichomonas musculus TaxID=1915356 RepID=A0ABR2KI72_9EUKA